jgi:hypothetical protein
VFTELPSYLVSTSYSLVLLLWLETCRQINAELYSARFRVMRAVVAVYIGALYAVALCAIGLLALSRPMEYAWVFSVGAALRDLAIAAIFAVFAVSLWCALDGPAPDERKLSRFTIVLALVTVAKGALPLVQGGLLREDLRPPSECKWFFALWWAVSEIGLNGVPLWFLINANNKFLKERNETLSERFQSLVDQSLMR